MIYQISYLGEQSTAIGGLTPDTPYYAINIDGNTIKLAQTPAEALDFSDANDTAIDLHSGGTGKLHNLKSSTIVTVGDSPIDGLEDNLLYNVTVIDANTIQLAESEAEAVNAAPIDLDPVFATGTSHAFQKATGIEISANLKAKDKVSTKGSTGSNPKIRERFQASCTT